MSSDTFVKGAAEAFRAAEAAFRDGHPLEAVLTPGLIFRSGTCSCKYDFFGATLYYDSAGYFEYVIEDGECGGFMVKSFWKDTCGGGTRAPVALYVVACPTIVDVAQVLLLDQGQLAGCQCWGRDSPLQTAAPTLAAALKARPHSLRRLYGRTDADVTVSNLLTMAEKLASGEKMETWDATLAHYGVTEADLVVIETYGRDLPAGPTSVVDSVLAQDEAISAIVARLEALTGPTPA